MSFDAVNSPAISRIRAAIPEFEDTFQEELREEDGELGPFQAMSLFARWVADRVRAGHEGDVPSRALKAIEQLIEDQTVELGDALAAEFIEQAIDEPRVVELMGPRTRERARGLH